jgi:hypothetical protein
MEELVGGPCAEFGFGYGITIVAGLGGGISIPDDADFWKLSDSEKIRVINMAREYRPMADDAMKISRVIESWGRQKNHGFGYGEKVRILSLIENAKDNPFLDEYEKDRANEITEFYPKTMDMIRDNHVTPLLRMFIIDRDGYYCHYCGNELEISDIHIDHVFPRSLGGRTHPDNLVVSCKSCNWKKGAKTDWKYRP